MSVGLELGPVDPRVPIQDESGKVMHYQAAREEIEAYADL
jgi:hypothetical protein